MEPVARATAWQKRRSWQAFRCRAQVLVRLYAFCSTRQRCLHGRSWNAKPGREPRCCLRCASPGELRTSHATRGDAFHALLCPGISGHAARAEASRTVVRCSSIYNRAHNDVLTLPVQPWTVSGGSCRPLVLILFVPFCSLYYFCHNSVQFRSVVHSQSIGMVPAILSPTCVLQIRGV